MIVNSNINSWGNLKSSASITILHIEDREADLQLISQQLQRSKKAQYKIDSSRTLTQACEQLNSKRYDTIFLDLSLPDSSGIDSLLKLREINKSIPIIILSNNHDEGLSEKVIYHGAQDFIHKDEFNAKTIDRTIRYAIDRKKAETELQKLAHNDPLTKLFNRVVFMDQLTSAIQKKAIHKTKNHIIVLLLDLDKFKHINDTFGHSVGDQLLIQTAERLKSCIRDSDTVARLGGDEFTILFENIEQLNSINAIANKIVNVLSEPFIIEGRVINTSTSIGVSSSFDVKNASAETILKNSDTAMYAAKNKGGNTVSFFTRELQISTQIRNNLERNLATAIDKDQLEVYFQPQVDIENQRISGAEALVRWNHPEHGVVSPAGFIPALEETGLIIPATEYIIRKSLEIWEKWSEEGVVNSSMHLSINIPPRYISRPNAYKEITDICNQYKVDSNQIEFELTENTFMDITPKNIEVLNKLSSEGYRFAIDDFGTGYSSLGYLKAFPINCLKLDRLFIKDILMSPKDEAIAETMILLCQKIGVTLIAEGVDTKEKLSKLKDLGCKIIQGFFFSKPLQAENFKDYIESYKNKV